MTLTEAIIHAEEVAEEIENACEYYEIGGVHADHKCAEEHKQLAEWLTILRDVYAVIEEYDIDFHREREDLTSMEVDILKALKV